MPKILKAAALSAGNRRLCILFLDERPKGPAKDLRGTIEGEEFELHIVHLDGGGRIHDEPRVGVELTERVIDATWFEGKEPQTL